MNFTGKLAKLGFAALMILCTQSAFSRNSKSTQYQPQRTDQTIRIDGIGDEEAWKSVEWGSDFVQTAPYSGEAPSQQTAFKILYDDNNLYILVRAYDDQPELIERRLTRRDQNEGDWISIGIDSYNDNLTAFNFGVSAAGVQRDLVTTNDDRRDFSWNAVYYTKTTIDKEGWLAEFKIPLSQIRFSEQHEQHWGFQITRYIFRKQERDHWIYVPKEVNGWVSQWGEINGIYDVKPKLEIELIPYIVTKAENFEAEEGNPFRDGATESLSMGLDGKVSVSNDFTLNFTINPDFGQVEADPSEVNLSAFETFFREQRPFFVEGKGIVEYATSVGGGPTRNDGLFYSRRIGRRPHGYPSLASGEYADVPQQTNILAAFKLSGKTRNGLSIGIMESVTPETKAQISSPSGDRKETVEPLTNYFLTRVQQDFNEGNTTVGGMFTATNRDINTSELAFLPTSSYTGGLDFNHYMKDRKYEIAAKLYVTNVSGSAEAITNLQQSNSRLYQRPDVTHVNVDTSLTNLNGFGGGIRFGKVSGHFTYGSMLNLRSPGLHVNDMGYTRNVDEIMFIQWAGYEWWDPFFIFNRLNINSSIWTGWDYAGTNLYKGFELNFNGEFKNFYGFGLGYNWEGNYHNRFELRGGPALVSPGAHNIWMHFRTDRRKKWQVFLNSFQHMGLSGNSRVQNYNMTFRYRATDALSLSLNPNYHIRRAEMQYVGTFDANGESQYMVAQIKSKQFGFSLRADFSLSSYLTVQYYGSPFIYAGKYDRFKRITNGVASEYTDRFDLLEGDQITYNSVDDNYTVDYDTDGTDDFTMGNPNFNFFQFNSNLVVRWEYARGAALYLVWSQGRTGYGSTGDFNFGNDLEALFDVTPHNVFLLKFSYRFVL
ncbi:MAG: hypothetical protein CL663_00100 [Bacteroidetes bacterium]|nr:hypothetical protein [Bacteroidota bacterium]